MLLAKQALGSHGMFGGSYLCFLAFTYYSTAVTGWRLLLVMRWVKREGMGLMEDFVKVAMPLILIGVLIFAVVIWAALDNPRSKKHNDY